MVPHGAQDAPARAFRRPPEQGRDDLGDFVLGLGAEEYIDYTREDVTDAVDGVDVAFDTVGGETTEALLPTVRQGGTLVTIAGAPPEDAARERGVRAELLVMSPPSEQLTHVAELVAAGAVGVEIAEVVSLAEVQRAHELSEVRIRCERASRFRLLRCPLWTSAPSSLGAMRERNPT